MDKAMTKDEKLITEYDKRKEWSEGCNYLNNVESITKFGEYSVAKLSFCDDIYNNALVESTTMYICDKKGVPHMLCTTEAGNANNFCSTREEIKKNQRALNNWVARLIAIKEASTGLKQIRYKHKVEALIKEVEDVLESGDSLLDYEFNDIFTSKELKSLYNAYFKKIEKYKLPNIEMGLQINNLKTKEEFYRNKDDESSMEN